MFLREKVLVLFLELAIEFELKDLAKSDEIKNTSKTLFVSQTIKI